MHRLLLAIALGSTLAIGTVAAGSDRPLLVEGKGAAVADPAIAIDRQAQQTIDAATAAALIGALQSRFHGQAVELRLGVVHSERVSLRDIALQGEARIRLEDATAWLPVRFEALYDTSGMVVESPHITLGAGQADGADASGLPIAELQNAVDSAMAAEFQSNTVEVDLGEARILDADGRHELVRAAGTALFDSSDRVPVTVHALYDRASGRWLDPQYDFDVLAAR